MRPTTGVHRAARRVPGCRCDWCRTGWGWWSTVLPSDVVSVAPRVGDESCRVIAKLVSCLGYSFSAMTLCTAAIMLLRCSFGTFMCAIGVAFSAVGEILSSISPLAIDFGTFMVTAGSACWGRTPSAFPESAELSPSREATPPGDVRPTELPPRIELNQNLPPPTISTSPPSYIFSGPLSGTGPSHFQPPLPSYFYQPPLLPTSPLAVYLSPDQLPRAAPVARTAVHRNARPTLTVVPCSASEDELSVDDSPCGARDGLPREERKLTTRPDRMGQRQRARAGANQGRATPSAVGAASKRTTPRATIE